MFESFFGKKNQFLSLNDMIESEFSSEKQKEILQIYQHNLNNFHLIKLDDFTLKIIELTIQIISKLFNFDFITDAQYRVNDPNFLHKTFGNKIPRKFKNFIMDFEFYGLIHQLFLGCKFSFFLNLC
jgi:hypothetical protein